MESPPHSQQTPASTPISPEDQTLPDPLDLWSRGDGLPEYLGAVLLVTRYERFGDLRDINPAIDHARQAVKLTPDAGQERVACLTILAAAHRIRFQRLSNIPDIDDAVERAREALRLTTEASVQAGECLHTLAWIYRTKYEVGQHPSDLQWAIEYYYAAFEFVSHTQLLRCLQGLSVSLGDRSQITRESNPQSSFDDATRALEYARDIVQQTQDQDRDRAAYSDHLASCLYEISTHPYFPSGTDSEQGKRTHLEEAISNVQYAVDETDERSPHRSRYRQNLASYLTRHSQAGDLENALDHYRESFTSPTPQPMQSFDAARRWASLAHLHKHNDCFAAYSTAFDLLPEILWIGNSLDVHRMACLGIEITQFTSNALRACIKHGDLKRGVTLVEQGLATSLRQRLQLKFTPRELRLDQPDRDALEQLSFVLCNKEASMEQRQHAAAERHILLAEIRRKPGLASFLRPKEYDELRHASKRGPVVILSSHESGCDAIILLEPMQDPLHVELPGVSPTELGEKKGTLDRLLRSTSRRESIHNRIIGRITQLWGSQAQYRNFVREGPNVEEEFEEVLEWLWGSIFARVYKELNANGIMDGRLWWCPTGSFIGLPLHAAVYSSASLSSQSSRFIQSYTLTLGALAEHDEPQNAGFPTGGNQEIRSIVKDHIQECQGNPTVQNVQKLLNECPWLHFACHGDPKPDDPRQSRLMLYKSNLDLDTIAQMQNPNAQFVFLVACHTGAGDSKLVNEALHITGGFIAAGFQGAIGTLWSICDDDGPIVAKTVYGHLFRNGQAPKVTDAAEALDIAVQELRRLKRPYRDWVPFVRIGV
ncbi:CHAT domain-containing protein [Mycena epipterygia]|nr:CHAT domain-containing protein [Mycena epipterygia]